MSVSNLIFRANSLKLSKFSRQIFAFNNLSTPDYTFLNYKHLAVQQITNRYQSNNTSNDQKPTPLTNGQKLKKAVKEYGATVIVFHVGISIISLGSCYLLVSGGLDTNQLFMTLGLNDWAVNSSLAANAGTFAIAYAVHKVFAPVRIGITLTSVPFIVRYLRNRGWLKK